jgi:hypothetical protein
MTKVNLKQMVMIATMAISVVMVSCGGGNSNKQDGDKIDAGKVVDEAVKEAEIKNSFSEAAAEAFMKKLAGLGKADLHPDFPYIIDEKTMGNYGDNNHAQFFFIKDGGNITKEEYQTWMKKVFDATASVADDKHNIQGYGFGKGDVEITFDEVLKKGLMKVWSYKYKGRIMDVYPDTKYGTFTTKEKTYGDGNGDLAVKIDITVGMQKSMNEYEKDIEKAFDEHGDEIKKALKDKK